MRLCIFFSLFRIILFSRNTKEVEQQIEIINEPNNDYVYDLEVNSAKRRFLFDSHANGNIIFKEKKKA